MSKKQSLLEQRLGTMTFGGPAAATPLPLAPASPPQTPPAVASPPAAAPSPDARTTESVHTLLATMPSTPPTSPAAQDSLPNRKKALAHRLTISLFETDLAHAEALAEHMRHLGHKKVQTSMILKVALRATAKNMTASLGKYIQEIAEEDGRRRRHKFVRK